jgi:hypothetical protein
LFTVIIRNPGRRARKGDRTPTHDEQKTAAGPILKGRMKLQAQ